MTDEEIRQGMINHLADLDETTVLKLVQQILNEGEDPLTIIKDCEQAMSLVGERYERREYYLSGLIMAGEILREVSAMVQPFMKKRLPGNASGRVLLGTVQGDIHDIGKGIVDVALRCYGFTVEDLGVDVPPRQFLEHIQGNPPDVIGLSGLLTVAYESMKETIKLLREYKVPGQPAIPIIIGGGMLNEKICRLVGADFWTADAMDGVRICQRILQNRTPHERIT
ncbi:MAG: cobalamin-dependent protein [Thermodesulfobacteriota bacterium]|jgi:methanogenic corrinoid protein MtbC1